MDVYEVKAEWVGGQVEITCSEGGWAVDQRFFNYGERRSPGGEGGCYGLDWCTTQAEAVRRGIVHAKSRDAKILIEMPQG